MHSKNKPQKLKFHSSEKWETLRGFSGVDGQRYAVSNFGRAISYWDTYDYGYFLKPSLLNKKYPCISLRKNGMVKTWLIHRLVAKHFLAQPTTKHRYVIHKDFRNENNYYQNLKWVTKEEMFEHVKQDPRWKGGRSPRTGKGHKLNESKVKIIKHRLASGKTRMKMIAKQFGISEMQLYRIKAGINWGHVKI